LIATFFRVNKRGSIQNSQRLILIPRVARTVYGERLRVKRKENPVHSGYVSDEARRNIPIIVDRVSEVGSRDSGKPLGGRPRNSAPKKGIALKARFNPAEEHMVQVCHALSALERRLFSLRPGGMW
jgi:hypothetical protein